MKIIDNSSKKVDFKDVGCGKVIRYRDSYFIKTETLLESNGEITINAIALPSGLGVYFLDLEPVQLVDVTLTIMN